MGIVIGSECICIFAYHLSLALVVQHCQIGIHPHGRSLAVWAHVFFEEYDRRADRLIQ